MKKTLTTVLVISLLAFLFSGWRWWTWSRGHVLAAVDTGHRTRLVIREIPYDINPLQWMFDSSGYIYRMERWEWPHIMTDCMMYSGSSYRAQTARIDYTPERTIFHLDNIPGIVLTLNGQWKSE